MAIELEPDDFRGFRVHAGQEGRLLDEIRRAKVIPQHGWTETPSGMMPPDPAWLAQAAGLTAYLPRFSAGFRVTPDTPTPGDFLLEFYWRKGGVIWLPYMDRSPSEPYQRPYYECVPFIPWMAVGAGGTAPILYRDPADYPNLPSLVPTIGETNVVYLEIIWGFADVPVGHRQRNDVAGDWVMPIYADGDPLIGGTTDSESDHTHPVQGNTGDNTPPPETHTHPIDLTTGLGGGHQHNLLGFLQGELSAPTGERVYFLDSDARVEVRIETKTAFDARAADLSETQQVIPLLQFQAVAGATAEDPPSVSNLINWAEGGNLGPYARPSHILDTSTPDEGNVSPTPQAGEIPGDWGATGYQLPPVAPGP